MTRRSTGTVISSISQQEGDRIAAAVLALVRSIVEPQLRAHRLEPTSCGHLPEDARHVVFNRSE